MALRRTGIAADYLGGDPALPGPLRGRLRLDPERGLRFAGREGTVIAVAPEDLEAAGVVERPVESLPLARRARMMAEAGEWDTGRLRVRGRRGDDPLVLELLVVSVDAATELSRYRGEREGRGGPPPLPLGPEDDASLPAAEEAEDG